MQKNITFKVDYDVIDIWSQNDAFNYFGLSRTPLLENIIIESHGYDESNSLFYIVLRIPKNTNTAIVFTMTSKKSNEIFSLEYDRITGNITTSLNLDFDVDIDESIEKTNYENMLRLFDYYTYRIKNKFNFNGEFINHILDIY